jgi:hypothetical protein
MNRVGSPIRPRTDPQRVVSKQQLASYTIRRSRWRTPRETHSSIASALAVTVLFVEAPLLVVPGEFGRGRGSSSSRSASSGGRGRGSGLGRRTGSGFRISHDVAGHTRVQLSLGSWLAREHEGSRIRASERAGDSSQATLERTAGVR